MNIMILWMFFRGGEMKLRFTVILAVFIAIQFRAPMNCVAGELMNKGVYFGSYPFHSSRVFQNAGFSYTSVKLRELEKKKLIEGEWVTQNKNVLVSTAFSQAAKAAKKYRGNGYALDNVSFQVVRSSKNISLYMDYNIIVLLIVLK